MFNLVDKNIINSIPKNLFVFARIKQNKVIPQPKLDSFLINEIGEFINNNIYTKVVLIIRSEREPYRTTGYPSSDLVTELVNKINKETHLFYQQPWPEPVPSFKDEDTMFVQLGFDEGSLLHKSKEIKGIGNEYIFLSNEHMFKLNKKKNELI